MDPDALSEHLAGLRQEYAAAGLDEAGLPATPLEALRRWLAEAETAGLHEPNAMVVATATADGAPSARTVLLKGLDERGLVFYTNYRSRKADELEAGARAAVLFPWHDLERQVRVEGTVERVSREQSLAYWVQRPRGSQLGAVASPQSQQVGSRAELDALLERAEREHPAEVPLPDDWGGYRVSLGSLELWQGGRGRMHDRLLYRPRAAGAPGWELVRLAP